MEPILLLQLLLVGLLIGTMIGAFGVGGILLSPLLVWIVGYDLHLAMATSLWSFLFTGIVGSITYARKGSVDWRMVGWITVGIIPAVFIGTRVNVALPTWVLSLLLASLLIFSGVNAIRSSQKEKVRTNPLPTPWLIAIGLFVGFGSALTGAGGAVLLLPITLPLGVLPLTTIGVAQVIQLPNAIFASAGFLMFGGIEFGTGTLLGIFQAIGVYFGAQIAHFLPAAQLKRYVAIGLIGCGIFMIGRLFF